MRSSNGSLAKQNLSTQATFTADTREYVYCQWSATQPLVDPGPAAAAVGEAAASAAVRPPPPSIVRSRAAIDIW